MDGINILNQKEIMETIFTPNFLSVIFIIICISAWVSLIIMFWDLITCSIGLFIGIALICLGWTGIIISVSTKQVPSGMYEYQIAIEEDINMNEFLEKYEIIEQNGKLLTIKDKDLEVQQ